MVHTRPKRVPTHLQGAALDQGAASEERADPVPSKSDTCAPPPAVDVGAEQVAFSGAPGKTTTAYNGQLKVIAEKQVAWIDSAEHGFATATRPFEPLKTLSMLPAPGAPCKRVADSYIQVRWFTRLHRSCLSLELRLQHDRRALDCNTQPLICQ